MLTSEYLFGVSETAACIIIFEKNNRHSVPREQNSLSARISTENNASTNKLLPRKPTVKYPKAPTGLEKKERKKKKRRKKKKKKKRSAKKHTQIPNQH